MDKNKYEAVRLKMEACAEALRKNNFYCECADSKEEALEIIESLIPYDSTVTVGGSMTLFECGVIDLLRNGDFETGDGEMPVFDESAPDVVGAIKRLEAAEENNVHHSNIRAAILRGGKCGGYYWRY